MKKAILFDIDTAVASATAQEHAIHPPFRMRQIFSALAFSVALVTGSAKAADTTNGNLILSQGEEYTIATHDTLTITDEHTYTAPTGSKTIVEGTMILEDGANINKTAFDEGSVGGELNIMPGGTVQMNWTPYYPEANQPGTDAYDPGQAANPEWLEEPQYMSFFPRLQISLAGTADKTASFIINNKGSRTEGGNLSLIICYDANNQGYAKFRENRGPNYGSITIGEYCYLEIPNFTFLPDNARINQTDISKSWVAILNIKNSTIVSERLTAQFEGNDQTTVTGTNGRIVILGKKDAGSSLTAGKDSAETLIFEGGSILQLGEANGSGDTPDRFGGTIQGNCTIGTTSDSTASLLVERGAWTIGTTQDQSTGQGNITIGQGSTLNIGCEESPACLIFSEGASKNADLEWGSLDNNGQVNIGSNGTLQVVHLTVEGSKLGKNATRGEGSYAIENGGDLIVTGKLGITGGDYTADFGEDTVISAEQMNMDSHATYTQKEGTLQLTGVGKYADAPPRSTVFTGAGIKVAGGNVCLSNNTAPEEALEIQGNVETSGGTLTLGDNLVRVSGSLTLGGGLLDIIGNGSLEVEGDFTISATTAVTLRNIQSERTLLSYTGNLTGDPELLTFDIEQKGWDVQITDGAILLKRLATQEDFDTMVQGNWGVFTASHAFMESATGQHAHARALATGNGSVWFDVPGGFHHISNDAAMGGSDIELWGGALGAEMYCNGKHRLGVAMGYVSGKVQPTQSVHEVEQDGTYFGLYGEHAAWAHDKNSVSLSWGIAYGRTESEGKLVGEAQNWEQNSVQMNIRATWSHALSKPTSVRAFTEVEYYANDSDTLPEGGKTGSIQNLRAEVGVGINHTAGSATFYGEVGFLSDLARNNPHASLYAIPGCGANPGRLGVGVKAGVQYDLGSGWNMRAGYNLEAMEQSQEHNVHVGVGYSF